jgi:hypothetical protein
MAGSLQTTFSEEGEMGSANSDKSGEPILNSELPHIKKIVAFMTGYLKYSKSVGVP